MSTEDRLSKVKRFLADTPSVIRFALPYIVVGGVLGALLGSALGSWANGFRVGVIVGGVVAFVGLQRRRKEDS